MLRVTTLLLALLALSSCRTASEPAPPADAAPSASLAKPEQPAQPATPTPAPDTTQEDLARALADAATSPLVRAAYAKKEGAAVFVRQNELTQAGSAALEVLDAVAAEAIEPAKVGSDVLAEARKTPDAALEVAIATGVAGWAREQWPGNPHRLTDVERANDEAKAIDERVRNALEAVLGKGHADAEATRAALLAMRPPIAQYEKLIPFLARYEKLAAAGGWETKFHRIPRPKPKQAVRYKPKRRVPGALLPAIKRRLHAEGFYASPEQEDAWNEEFEAALVAYREVNQLWPRVWIDWELLESLRLPVEFRVIQLKLALERMRRSRVGDDSYYVHVNVPEFHAEVWENGAQLLRFRVVVGGRQRYRAPKTGEWRFPNATPLFSDKFETVVLNPYWTVPPRLRKDLRKKQERDPTYFATQGYEEIGAALRQKPGPSNALGRVKFLFPNAHSVYMHDTPRKDLFRSPMRAFSHGCVRVEEPLDFAWFLLEREGRDDLSKRRVRRNAFGGGQFRYKLANGPKIHIEYWTAHVDDKGRVHFLEDIYLYDSTQARDRWGLDLGNLK
jgi:murein L,D-transpeptidase YcbB/YkuD